MLVRVSILTALVVAAVLSSAATIRAQVSTAITPSGGAQNLGTTVTQTGSTWDITGGTRITNGTRSNLFHSFGLFSVGAGDIANFNNTTGQATSNIIGRVTGGEVSSIFGTIQTTNFPGTNLFLINPAGWVFGPGATLNVSGSFHVSTADYLRFTDGSTFCVNGCLNGQANTLSVADAAAFGFLGLTPAPISIQQSFLQVPEGQTLSVVGGDLQISDSFLMAPAGRVQLGSFASAGEATVSGLDGAFSALGAIQLSNSSLTVAGTATVDADGNVVGIAGGSVLIRGGEVNISGATLDASGGLAFDENFNIVGTASGNVVIRGGQLLVTGSTISASNFGNTNGAEVAIGLEATGDITLSGGTGLQAFAAQQGDAGDVRIRANSLQMQDFAFIDSITIGGGRGADVSIEVGSLTLAGAARVGSQSLGQLALPGPGGDITVVATGPVTITGGSQITSQSLTSDVTGSGGAISLSAQSLTVDQGGTIGSASLGVGPGGDIAINVQDLTLTSGGTIQSSTALAAGGNITVAGTGSVTIAGIPGSDLPDSDLPATGILSVGALSDSGVAPPGSILLSAGRLIITDAGVVQNGSLEGPAVAGIIVVNATDSITISNRGKILSQAVAEAVGDVFISAPSLSLDNGLIQVSTIQAGNAGNIFANVGNLSLTAGGQMVTSSASTNASGSGGNLSVIVSDSALISGRSSGPSLSPFIGDGRSGLFSTAEGSGPAGTISLTANRIQLLDGGTISANSTGTVDALAGNVTIVTNDLTMNNGSITTESLLADGGNISITTTGSRLYLLDSQITTSVQSGAGQGGNITLGSQAHPVEFVILNGSEIRADAFGGPGGNINILADVYLTSDSVVSASSALSTPGIIDIQARFTNVSGSLAQLPEAVLQAAALLRASCAARLSAGKTSSLVVAGREGLPLEPGGVMPSPLVSGGPADTRLSSGDGQEWESLGGTWQVSLRSKCSM